MTMKTVQHIYQDRDRVRLLLDKNKNTELGAFMDRFLDWHNNPNKKPVLIQLFSTQIDFKPRDFQESFANYVEAIEGYEQRGFNMIQMLMTTMDQREASL